MSDLNRTARLPALIAVLVPACLAAAVFFPILDFEFIDFDITNSVVDNPYIRGFTAENLKYIFTTPCIQSYYPVRTLTFVLDYSIWGLDPRGFKLTNGLVHLANVLLLSWLIRRMAFSWPAGEGPRFAWREALAAAFACGVFAVHPLVVEPVTWVPGREELLMTLGALACLHFHLSARQAAARGERPGAVVKWHVLATIACLMACLSNVIGLVIPALVVAWDWLTLPAPKLGRTIRASLAMWLIAAATLASKVSRWGVEPDPTVDPLPFVPAQQLRLVLEAYWLNLKSLVWPTGLALCYDNRTFPQSLFDRQVVLGILAAGLMGLLLWQLRRQKVVFYGLLWFLIALGPAAQIMPHHIHQADRFLYLPLAGLAMAVAAGIGTGSRLLGRKAGITAAGLGAGVLLALAAASSRQVQTWQNTVTVWENAVTVTPNDGYLHDLLAEALVKRGQVEQALRHSQRSLELDFQGHPRGLCTRAMTLALRPEMRLEDRTEAVRLATRACELTDWKDPRCRNALAASCTGLADAQAAAGQLASTLENYRRAIQMDDKYEMALLNLALVLATSSDQAVRNPEEAVRLAERACSLVGNPSPDALRVLAEAYYAAGRRDQALATAERVAQIFRESGDDAMCEGVRQWIEAHR